jgi:hypothetical protein
MYLTYTEQVEKIGTLGDETQALQILLVISPG